MATWLINHLPGGDAARSGRDARVPELARRARCSGRALRPRIGRRPVERGHFATRRGVRLALGNSLPLPGESFARWRASARIGARPRIEWSSHERQRERGVSKPNGGRLNELACERVHRHRARDVSERSEFLGRKFAVAQRHKGRHEVRFNEPCRIAISGRFGGHRGQLKILGSCSSRVPGPADSSARSSWWCPVPGRLPWRSAPSPHARRWRSCDSGYGGDATSCATCGPTPSTTLVHDRQQPRRPARHRYR
jgi:hypothetical protein